MHLGSHVMLQNALDGCEGCNFPFQNALVKSASKSSLFAFWRRDPVLELQFPRPIVICVVLLSFCNSVSAELYLECFKSRLLGAAAACVILFSFAAEDRKSYWSGCIQICDMICQQIFSILAVPILKNVLLKSASKSSFFRFGVEIRFWSCNFRSFSV